ncbi:uncharacterized protein LOC116617049 [Nematostella vectensis]|uniref:uncharacterized protein LOC116617049 n=1 Tax=Nematostella vectensis TaxID=45351 RepID=UPI002077996D|nr:uncharacterized protein LOC116617049 [Nematostella vectensis]
MVSGSTTNGYYQLVDNHGNTYKAYCDFNSEPGVAWTLMMSFSLTNNASLNYGAHRCPVMRRGCAFSAVPGSVHSEDNFGYYGIVNNKSRCTESPSITTQYWFGGSK